MTGKQRRSKLKRHPKRFRAPYPSGQELDTAHPGADVLIVVSDADPVELVVFVAEHRAIRSRTQIYREALPNIYLRLVARARDVLQNCATPAELAEIGHKLFLDLFPQETLRQTITQALSARQSPIIEVASKPHLLPWNLIHLHGERDPDLRWFFGTQAGVRRSLMSEREPRAPSPLMPPRVAIQIGVDTSLTHAVRTEVPHIENLPSDRALSTRLPPFDSALEARDEQKRLLRRLLMEGRADIIHFACHGDKGEERGCATFTIDRSYPVRADNLFGNDDRLAAAPIVFLNACEMGFDAPDKDQAFIRVFLERGARAVVAPECHVSDELSAWFACEVYDKLVREKLTLADAVRRASLGHHVLGLMYTVHGQSNARLS